MNSIALFRLKAYGGGRPKLKSDVAGLILMHLHFSEQDFSCVDPKERNRTGVQVT